MPTSESPTKTEESKWITVGGKKIEIKPGEEGEEYTREKLPSVRGEKEKNTKEALSKAYTKRFNIHKSIFSPRDEVVYDEYRKSGIVAGSDGDKVKVLSGGIIYSISKNSVFKKSELIGDIHWDTLSVPDRILIINKHGLDANYVTRDWANIQPNIRTIIQKESPAGYSSVSSGTNNPVYNPLNDDKTVSQRIKEEEESQHENSEDETQRDTKKV